MREVQKYIILSIGVGLLSVGISTYLLFNATPVPLPETVLAVKTEAVRHRAYSSDPLLYAITATSTYVQKYSDHVFGGIVSHHLLANIDIGHFFAEFSDQAVKRVVIIGPNHYYPNDASFISTTRGYETPFGAVDIDVEMVNELVASGVLTVSPEKIEEEHSISSLVPYVAAYFPQATLVPIIVSARPTEAELTDLAAYLSAIDSVDTIVVASVDFSHHLYSNASRLHDARTITALTSFDYTSLLNAEVDSPDSLYVLLKYLESKGAQNLTVQSQNSAKIFNQYDSEDVTSYVFAHGRRGPLVPTNGIAMLFFGDTMLGRGMGGSKNPFSSIKGPEGNFLKGFDAVIVNLEGAIERSNCTLSDDDLLISPTALSLLTNNRITHVGITNNHFGRCPADALSQSILTEAKLQPIDEVGAVIAGTNSTANVVSFFASPVPNDTSRMIQQVKELAASGEPLIVFMHWGVEYDTEPGVHEKAFARALIDAGADMIIGHHPHVVQPVEVYNDGIILYSIGNFISDQTGERTKEGIAVGLFATSEKIQATLFPFRQTDGIPQHMTQVEARTFCERVYVGDVRYLSPDHPCIIEVMR